MLWIKWIAIVTMVACQLESFKHTIKENQKVIPQTTPALTPPLDQIQSESKHKGWKLTEIDKTRHTLSVEPKQQESIEGKTSRKLEILLLQS
jgi:hypothetical protein